MKPLTLVLTTASLFFMAVFAYNGMTAYTVEATLLLFTSMLLFSALKDRP